jgi:hypothetical protein
MADFIEVYCYGPGLVPSLHINLFSPVTSRSTARRSTRDKRFFDAHLHFWMSRARVLPYEVSA